MNGKWCEIPVTPSERELLLSQSLYFSRFLPNRPRPLSSFDTCKMAARNAKRSISMILQKNRGLLTVYLKIHLSVIATTGIKFKSAFLVHNKYWATGNFSVFGQFGKSY